MNLQRARELLRELLHQGVREFVVCSGSRNSPLVVTLRKRSDINLFQHFEERAASFFALGRTRLLGAPVAIITTSGTAAAEVLPAVVEASYSHIPLVVITADRPRRFRGTGSPQCIEQKDLFSPYAHVSVDLDENDIPSLSHWTRQGPCHINICFDEPLLDTVSAKRPVDPKVQDEPLHQPLVIVGSLLPDDRESVVNFLEKASLPVYAEGISGIRERSELKQVTITAGDRSLYFPEVKSILRIGGVPTTSFWRKLEYTPLPVTSVSRLPFPGLSRAQQFLQVNSFDSLSQLKPVSPPTGWTDLFDANRSLTASLERLFYQYPYSEPALLRALSECIPNGSTVYLGNSLPIREWDLAATFEHKGLEVLANRGANGIDGQLSTFFGVCHPQRENWALLGDLTLLYDVAAPWILPQLGSLSVRVVVINNGGGKIFSRMYEDEFFQNRHQLSFESFAKMWSFEYVRWRAIPQKLPEASRLLIELVPDEVESRSFWDDYERINRCGQP